MARKTKKTAENPVNNKEFTPFDKENVIRPLKLFITIVTHGQGDGIVKLMEKAGATFSFITNGEGTGRNYLPNLLSGADTKKQIVFTFVREDNTEAVCEALKNRFSLSRAANGISLSVKLTSVAGVSVYRFLTNVRKVKKVQSDDEY